MTFKELRKRFSSQQQEQEQKQQSNLTLLSNRLKNKPFCIWNIPEHKQQNIITKGDCCFNHIIRLPQKDGITKPLFDYLKILYDTLFIEDGSFKDRHLFVKKATGIGSTEFVKAPSTNLCIFDL